MSSAALTHAELSRTLVALRSGVGASDLHGSLIGYLCGGGEAGAQRWVDALALDLGEPETTRTELADRLYRECRAELDDPELKFEPLLPATRESLSTRADALVDWCRGFLGGVGLAGAADAAAKSTDGAEILHDLGDIARSRFEIGTGESGESGESEEDERALAELVEFVRVGVLLLYAELVQNARPPTLH
ncbi:MAG: UPF0149 family protein [Rhodanobacteraceae bacterium]